METTTRLILPDVAEALRTDPGSVVELTDELHPPDIADIVVELDEELGLTLVRALPVEMAARVFAAIDPGRRVDLYKSLLAAEGERAIDIAEEMSPDDRADLLAELDEEARSAVLARMDRAESREVRALLAYPEGTAGALMTTAFLSLSADLTAGRAIEEVRRIAAEMETIYDAYAVDPSGLLVGVVSLRDLVIAPAEKTIREIMEPHVIAVPATADQEEVARLVAKYDLFALPVLDEQRRIVGIITIDDVVDVVEEEATEDVQRLGAVEPLEGGYFATGFWEFVRKRAGWLVVLFLGELFTASAMRHYEDSFRAVAALVIFIPLIISSGGNAGSQSASLMIRSLALGDVRPRDFGRVIVRELVIGLTLGIGLCVFGIARVLLWDQTRSVAFAVTVAAAIVGVVTLGAVVGSGFPLILKRLGLDPAVSSTPFIASLVDVLGLILYFEIAKIMFF